MTLQESAAILPIVDSQISQHSVLEGRNSSDAIGEDGERRIRRVNGDAFP